MKIFANFAKLLNLWRSLPGDLTYRWRSVLFKHGPNLHRKYSTLIFNSFYVSIVLTVKFKNSIRVNKTITSILTKYCQCSTFLNILSNNNEIDGRFDAKPSKELAFAKPVPRKLQSQLSNSMVVYIMQECTFEGQTFQIPLVRSDAKSSTN